MGDLLTRFKYVYIISNHRILLKRTVLFMVRIFRSLYRKFPRNLIPQIFRLMKIFFILSPLVVLSAASRSVSGIY